MAKRKLPPRPDSATSDILKILERVSYGHSPHQVFRDWLDLCNANLDELPNHIERLVACRKAGTQFDLAAGVDTPPTQELYARLRGKYQRRDFEAFAETFAILLMSTTGPDGQPLWQDVPGTIFETWELTSDRAGQFFTPMNLCHCMARLTMGDAESIRAEIKKRLMDAADKSGLGEVLGVLGLLESGESAPPSPFRDRLLASVLTDFKPISVMDCCVGAGRMLLAAAAAVPPELLPFYSFWGIDIDAQCVAMSRLNLRLYGLNGYGVKCVNALTEMELACLPEPQAEAAREVVAASAEHEAVADDASAERVAAARRNYLAVNGQLQMFDFAEPEPETTEQVA